MLVVYVVIIGIALVVFLVGAMVLSPRQQEHPAASQSGVSLSVAVSAAPPSVEVWQPILEHYPKFSAPAFLAFATRLYCDVLQEIPGGHLRRTGPFLSTSVREKLVLRGSLLEEIRDVVVASATLSGCKVQASVGMSVDVEVKATYAARREGETKTFRAEERWTFETGWPNPERAGGEVSWVLTGIEVEALEAVESAVESRPNPALATPRVMKQPTQTSHWPAYALVGLLGAAALVLAVTLKRAHLPFHEMVNVMGAFLALPTLVVGVVVSKRLGLFLQVCPVCNKRALDVSSRVVVRPTEHVGGHGIKVEKCRNCLQQVEYPYDISRSTPA